jgi:hypothetical protein
VDFKANKSLTKQRVTRFIVPVLFFGLPGAVIYFAALPEAHGFVLALLLSVILNSIFFFIMRAPTARGLVMLQQLAGFREFLMRVEQDPLDRINTPEQRAELMNRFLPYAIALNVREGWGDKMASAFSCDCGEIERFTSCCIHYTSRLATALSRDALS